MAKFSPKRWTRQPQIRVQVDPVWLAKGLNLALIPFGAGFVDCSPRNAVGSGGVRSVSSCRLGNTVLRTSGVYAIRGLNENVSTFSRIVVFKQAATGEAVFSCSSSSTTNNSAQFSSQSGQFTLVAADQALIATSTGAGLTTGQTHVGGITYNNAAASTTFYCDGRQLNTVSASRTFLTETSGALFVKPNGGNPFTGGMALHLDFNTVLSHEDMRSLTANPWQVFISKPEILLDVPAAGAATHTTTGVLTGSGSSVVGSASSATTRATSGVLTATGVSIVGSAARTREHANTGVLTGQGSSVVGSASSKTTRTSTGALVGSGSVIVGAASSATTRPSSGVLVGGGASIVGSASRNTAAVTHATTAVLLGGTGTSIVVGSSNRTREHSTTAVLLGGTGTIVGSASSKTTRTSSGVLVGQGAVVVGAASSKTTRTSSGALVGAGAIVVGASQRGTIDHATSGILVGSGADVVGNASGGNGDNSRAHKNELRGSIDWSIPFSYQIKETKELLHEKKEELVELKKEKKQFSLEKEFAELEALQQEIDELAEQIAELEDLFNQLKRKYRKEKRKKPVVVVEIQEEVIEVIPEKIYPMTDKDRLEIQEILTLIKTLDIWS